jgi:DNA (cytosine-5)-methyltransferase 1
MGGRRLRSVDLFAGAGGLSQGLGRAGLAVTAACEWDDDACDTYSKSHPRTEVFRCGLEECLPELAKLNGSIDIVAGGPPCQPWSSGGKRLGAADPRDGLPLFRKTVGAVGPTAFLLENVAGLASRSRAAQLVELVSSFEAMGYTVTWRVLNAAQYGVPQKRMRLVVVGIRGAAFEFPQPTHGPGRAPYVAARSVLDPMVPLGEPNASVVRYAKSPDLRATPYGGLLWNGGGRPINLDEPAPTLLASMGGNKTPWVDTEGVVVEYHAHLMSGGTPRVGRVPGARRITPAEAAAIQTFDEDTVFFGARSSQYRQIGNAVPPRLAEHVGRALVAQLT